MMKPGGSGFTSSFSLHTSSSRQPQIFQHLHRRERLVERVEMQAGHTGAQQLLALLRGVFNAELQRRVVIRADLVQFFPQHRRNFCAAELGELLDSRGTDDGDDAGHQRK